MNDHDEPRWTLVTLLEADVTSLDHAQTVDYLKAISRAEARLEAARLRATRHFSTLHERTSDAPARLAHELKITRHNAARDVKLAHALTSRLPHTLAALDKGELDAARAAQVVRATRRLTDVQARSVDDRLYPVALDKKPKPLSDFLRNAVAQENPRDSADGAGLQRSAPHKAPHCKASPSSEEVGVTRLLTHVHVVATADTLAGFDDLAGLQRGYGLIPAERVRELAYSRNAIWTWARSPDEAIAGLRPGRNVRSRPKRGGLAWWRSDRPDPWLSKRRRKTSRRVNVLASDRGRKEADPGAKG